MKRNPGRDFSLPPPTIEVLNSVHWMGGIWYRCRYSILLHGRCATDRCDFQGLRRYFFPLVRFLRSGQSVSQWFECNTIPVTRGKGRLFLMIEDVLGKCISECINEYQSELTNWSEIWIYTILNISLACTAIVTSFLEKMTMGKLPWQSVIFHF